MLRIAALLCLALMTGNELCIAVFINPVLRKLPESEQVPFLRRAASQLGLAMPFWYFTSIVLTIACAFVQHRATGQWASRATTSAALQALVLILTIGFMVPINNRLGKLAENATGWTPEAVRWDRMHQLRVVLLLCATIALAVS